MLSHHIQRNMVMGNVNPKSIDKKCITVRDKLNSLYCCPTQILWREKKDHSAYQVTEQVKSRELLKERVREGLGLFCCFFLWHLLAWSSQHLGRALSPLSANTLLCVIHQPAVFHLPAPVQHRPGEGPVVGARYDSLDILFKVLERLVPPDPCKEVGLGSFFQHLQEDNQKGELRGSTSLARLHCLPITTVYQWWSLLTAVSENLLAS